MESEQRFTLDSKHKFPKMVCPNCGKPKHFTPYIDSFSGEMVSELCGMCDNPSCYHLPPREYFRFHPEAKNGLFKPDSFSGAAIPHLWQKNQNTKPETPQKYITDVYPDWPEQSVDEHLRNPTAFLAWLYSLWPFKDPIDGVVMQYCLGRTREGNPLFWYLDENERGCDCKSIAYDSNGHRLHTETAIRYYFKKIAEQQNWPMDSKPYLGLFGLHILDKYPEADVCIVESEKTAILGSIFDSMVTNATSIWLATGSMGMLTAERCKPLKGRCVLLFPDNDAKSVWGEKAKSVMANVQVKDYTLVDVQNFARCLHVDVTTLGSKFDVGDVIVAYAKRRYLEYKLSTKKD